MTDATQGRAIECGMNDTSRHQGLDRKDVVLSQMRYSTRALSKLAGKQIAHVGFGGAGLQETFTSLVSS